jgi:hypothetical protein
MKTNPGIAILASLSCVVLLVLGTGFSKPVSAPLNPNVHANSARLTFSCDGWTGDDIEHQDHFWTDRKIAYSPEEHGVKVIGQVGKSSYFLLYVPNEKVPEHSKLMVGRHDSDGFEARTVSFVTSPVLLSVNRVGEQRQAVECSTGQMF